MSIVLLIATGIKPVQAERYEYSSADTLAALAGASPTVHCIISSETGGTFDPNQYSPTNDEGPAQLHVGGAQYREFFSMGYDDPWDPYQAVPYVTYAVGAGEAGAWTKYDGC